MLYCVKFVNIQDFVKQLLSFFISKGKQVVYMDSITIDYLIYYIELVVNCFENENLP